MSKRNSPPDQHVAICYWTKQALLGLGSCYKQKFYGIPTHRCMQVAINPRVCNLSCGFCWRNPKTFTPANVNSVKDNYPTVNSLINEHKQKICGFGSNPLVKQLFFTDAIKPVFCTVSLAGEPTLSPILGQLLKDLKERGFVTFVVSNGTRMHKVKDLKYLPDQFYLSISAIDRKSFDYLCNPIDPSDWDRFIDGLEILRNLNTRTVARVLFLKGFTENRFNELAILIRKALPSYVELKAYEHRGASTKNFQTQCVPSMLDIEKGAKKIASETGYIISLYESRSRVALLCRDSYAESNRLLLGVA